MAPRLLLASASPRRAEILESLGLTITVHPAPGIDEPALTLAHTGDPVHLPRAIAQAKAAAIAVLHPESLVIGADTIVVVDHQILGKPRDPLEATAFLQLLSGRAHQVITGLALIDGATGRTVLGEEVTTVHFAPLSAADIAGYVASGEPEDKAGAYGIQGLGSLLISGIEGDYWNVVGFPIYRFRRLLAELGYALTDWVWAKP